MKKIDIAALDGAQVLVDKARMPNAAPDTQVLIAGAGPTGLVLALWLARRGVRVRIIDKAAEPGTTSRALAVQARTLEFYRQLGIADDVVAAGIRFAAVNLWSRGRHVARLALGDLGVGDSPFPFVLIFPQDEHERLLIEQLHRAGVEVERPVELLDFDEGNGRVTARLRHADGSEEHCTAEYLAGCDGARSRVREVIGSTFGGGTYAHLFYVADVVARGEPLNGELHGVLDEDEFLAIFPMKGEHRARFIGAVPPDVEHGDRPLTWNDMSERIVRTMGIEIERVNWFSTYHVHHRIADSFRVGRAFLVGDAAHIHSPVGGQGMNTGIGDAVNLAWKLADVVHRRASAALLDTYEPERIAFARRLVRTTDRGFVAITSPKRFTQFIRTRVAPALIPQLARLDAFRHLLFRTVSQTLINYRASPLSDGRVGNLHGGDRLPWVELGGPGEPRDNFVALESRDWQTHVYGEAPAGLAEACEACRLPLVTFRWTDAADKVGLERGAIYVIRPDGYIASANHAGAPAPAPAYATS